jgi:hypothetical protein
MTNVTARLRDAEPFEFCNRDMCQLNGRIIILFFRANDWIRSWNPGHTKFLERHAYITASYTAQSRQIIAGKAPRVSLAD